MAEDNLASPNTPKQAKPSLRTRLNPKNWTKHTIALGLIILVAVSAGLVYALVRNNDSFAPSSSNPAVLNSATVSGQVEVSRDGKSWISIKGKQQVPAGSYIRNAIKGRSIVVFSNQNLLRLDHGTTIRIDSLTNAGADVSLSQGHVYTKNTDEKFRNSLTYKGYTLYTRAGGSQTSAVSGRLVIQVYEKSAQIDTHTKDQLVSLYLTQGQGFNNGSTANLSIASLQKDDFLLWNLNRDQNNPELKNRLGFLKALATKLPDVISSPLSFANSSSRVVLTGSPASDGKFILSWKIYGVKDASRTFLKFNRTDANYVTVTDNSVFVGNRHSYAWDFPDGKPMQFQICILNPKVFEEDEYCGKLKSNVVKYDAPYIPDRLPTQGQVTLSVDADQKTVNWTAEGTAPRGYVVLSGDSTWLYFAADKTKESSFPLSKLHGESLGFKPYNGDELSHVIICKLDYDADLSGWNFVSNCSKELYVFTSPKVKVITYDYSQWIHDGHGEYDF